MIFSIIENAKHSVFLQIIYLFPQIFQVWTLFAAYVLTVILYWNEQSKPILRMLSIPVWTALIFHLAGVAGPLRVPIVIAVAILIFIGFLAEVKSHAKKSALEGKFRHE